MGHLGLSGCIMLLGPPACGKGTQADLLAFKYSVPHISLGDILRTEILGKGSNAREAANCVEAGIPVPVYLMSSLLRNRLAMDDVRTAFIGDGLVRTLDQAQEFQCILGESKISLRLVIYIDIAKEEAAHRVNSRMICSHCGKIYSISNKSLHKALLCESDGHCLIKRSDDNPEILADRIRAHYESIDKIIGFYDSRDLLRIVDGMQSIPHVHRQVLQMCDEYAGMDIASNEDVISPI